VTVETITQTTGRIEPRPHIELRGETTSPKRLFAELWAGRELMIILARKDFQVRYRRASLGIIWAVALPLIQTVVLAVVFSRVAHIRAIPHVNYLMFILSGMTPWMYFSLALPAGSTAVVDGSDMASKVYFPRALLPMSQLVTALYGFAITVAILLVFCPVMGVHLGVVALLVLPGTLLMVSVTCGFVLVISALHVYFRDLRYMVSAALLVWMYATPIVYSANSAPRILRGAIDLNPMTGVVDVFRAATVGHVGPLLVPVLISVTWSLALSGAAMFLHCRFNRVFADLL